MPKKVIVAENGPKAVGPYSSAIEADGFVYTSGALPVEAVTGQVVGGDIKSQTEKVLENLQLILKAAGTDVSKVVKTTVFMTNLADFANMNEVYAKVFCENPPARTTVQVVALPKGVMVEIEAVASKK
ncbi:MAG: reactive intermediate/imine deaminase [Elusimicrobia bacterium]|nr:reactive intermediate/imine deaminase [Elusimicrobiota bacterium]